MQIAALGFFLVIVVGGLILMLPVCNQNGEWLNFVDALFTSCACVSVTGLITITPATQFSLLGKIVLLILIQIGGWGIVVCAMYLLMLFKARVTIGQSVVMQGRFGSEGLSGLSGMVRYVVRRSLAVELIGAVGYSFYFIPAYGAARGAWLSVFHSVSAFCNAGLDILGDDSFSSFVNNPLINIVTVSLVIVSGLGFVVWKDVADFFKRIVSGRQSIMHSLRKLSLHSKLVLLTNALLLASGTIFFFCVEYANEGTFGGLSLGNKWMAAFFQSVTTRSSGFYTVSQVRMRGVSKLVGCILMYIGGSPGSTAGGIKTVTFAVIMATCWSIFRGRKDTECFNRRIPEETVRTSLCVSVAGLILLLTGTIVLALLEPHVSSIEVMYEAVSATATVGLTMDVTPSLSTAGKYVVIVLMYLGRIGPVTFPFIIAGSIGRKKGSRTLPQEHIAV